MVRGDAGSSGAPSAGARGEVFVNHDGFSEFVCGAVPGSVQFEIEVSREFAEFDQRKPDLDVPPSQPL